MSADFCSKPVIVVTGADLAAEAIALLEPFDLVYAGKAPTETELVDICTRRQPVAIIVRYGKITARIIDACENLRVISKHGTGIDTIDGNHAKTRGIAVVAAAGANAAAVAEHTWALIFACAKAVPHLDRRMHEGYWDKATHKSLELKGRTLALIGIGAIGQRVAEIALALEMRVIAYDPYAKKNPLGISMVDLPTALADSDVISLHCPLTEENRQMINHETLASMRDGAIIINTARGGLIDEEALLAALHNGKIRAAGLDSFETEPLLGRHQFADVSNVVLSPHIGGVTADAYVGMGVAAAQNIIKIISADMPLQAA